MKNEVHKIAFSVVTTCRNEIQSLPGWKMNILHQTRPPHEIVVVDAFSDDGTYEFLTEWRRIDSRVRVIQEKGPAAYGRNLAIRQRMPGMEVWTSFWIDSSFNPQRIIPRRSLMYMMPLP